MRQCRVGERRRRTRVTSTPTANTCGAAATRNIQYGEQCCGLVCEEGWNFYLSQCQRKGTESESFRALGRHTHGEFRECARGGRKETCTEGSLNYNNSLCKIPTISLYSIPHTIMNLPVFLYGSMFDPSKKYRIDSTHLKLL